MGDYTYLGMLESERFRLTRASKMTPDSAPVRAFDFFVHNVIQLEREPGALEIWHEGRCGRCGRKLTVPESIAAGIGPECAGRMGL